MNKARKHFTSLFALLLLFFTVSPSAFADDNDWNTIGECKIIDGWVIANFGLNPEAFPLTATIQRHKSNENLYRVLNPYEKIESIAKIKNASEYSGEIIFDISDREWIAFEKEVFAGFKDTTGEKHWHNINEVDFEIQIVNAYGWFLGMANGQISMARSYTNMLAGGPDSTYEETPDDPQYIGVLTVNNAAVCGPDGNPMPNGKSGKTAKIYIPKVTTPQPSDWLFNSDFDMLDFYINGEKSDFKYDAKIKKYILNDIEVGTSLTVKLKESYQIYNIIKVSVENQDKDIAIEDSKKEFTINQPDFQGAVTFNVEINSEEPVINFVTNVLNETRENSAVAHISYYSTGVQDDAVFKVIYGDSKSNMNLVADGTSSKASLPITDLNSNQNYTYYAQVIAYDIDEDELVRSEIIEINFKTGNPFNIDEDVAALDYYWDTHIIPDNKYSFLGFIYYEPQVGSNVYKVTATGGTGDIPARLIRRGVNENGMVELNMIFSYLFTLYDRPNFVISQSNSNREGRKLFYPNAEGVRQINPENGKRYALGSYTNSDPGYDFGYVEDPNFSYFIIGDENDHRIASEKGYTVLNKMVYNVLVSLEFDPSDTSFEEPKYITFNFEEEPKNEGMPMLIGTLAQTSKEYADKMVSSDPDNYGGWNTYVPLESHNGGYPYTYTFKPNKGDTEYDFALFLNVPAPEGTPSQGDALYLADKEMYPYLSFWSDEYEWTTSLQYLFYPNEGPKIVDLKGDRGITKPFPGHYGASVQSAESKYPSATSIHLSNLKEGQVYRLTINDPFVINWNNELAGETEENASRYHVADALAFISLMEYEPEVKSYQLVEHVGEKTTAAGATKVYYTYDVDKYNKKDKTLSPTYRLEMNADNNILLCAEVTNVDESTAFVDGEYVFTDLLFVRTLDPQWMKENKMVNVRIKDIDGNFIHSDKEEEPIKVKKYVERQNKVHVYSTDDYYTDLYILDKLNGEFGFAYAIVPMYGNNSPLDAQRFTLAEGYTYDPASDFYLEYRHYFLKYIYEYEYQKDENGDYVLDQEGNKIPETDEQGNPVYARDEDGNVIFVRDDEGNVQYEIVTDSRSSYQEEYIKVKATTVGDREGWYNQDVIGLGQLGVPEPMSGMADYELITDRVVEPQKNMTLRFYAKDLQKNYSGQHPSTTYLEREYMLPENLYLHAHDYHVRLPYEPSNVTSDLGKIMNEENVHFYLNIVENQSITKPNRYSKSVYIDPVAYSIPGFYNADMEDIYKDYESGSSPTTRSMVLNHNGAGEIYARGFNEMKAGVTLELAGSEFNTNPVFYNTEKDKDGNTVITNVYQEVVDNGDGSKSLVIAMPGINLLEANKTGSLNTSDILKNGDHERTNNNPYLTAEDFIKAEGEANGNLTPEEFFKVDGPEYTTLYLVEFDVPTLSQTLSPQDGAEVKVKLADNLTLDNDKKHYIKLLTRDELLHYRFPVVVLDQNYTGSTDNLGGVTLKMTDYVPEDFTYNFTVRNVYLFPEDNVGFMDEATADMHQTGVEKGRKKAVDATNAVTTTTYHALTPTAVEHTLVVTSDEVTAVEEVNADERGALVRVEGNMIELLDDDVMLFNVNGALIASGRQTIHVAPDVYIAVAGRRVQKVAIR